MLVIFSYLFLLLSVIVFVVIGVIISLLGQRACITKVCVLQSKFIEKGMNKNLDPCNDFYSFVCNRFAPYGDTIFDKIALFGIKSLNDYLNDGPPDWENNNRVEHIAKTLFSSCTDDSALIDEGLGPLQRSIIKIGGIPFLDSLWQKRDGVEFEEIIYDLKHYFTGLRAVFVYNRVIRLKQYPSVPPKNYSSDELKSKLFQMYDIPQHLYSDVAPSQENYLKFCIEFHNLYYKGRKTNNKITDEVKKSIKDAFEFKKKLLELVDKVRNCSAPPYHFVTFPGMEQFGKLRGKPSPATLDDYIKAKTVAYISSYALVSSKFKIYIEQLQKLVKETPDTVIGNYMGVEGIIQFTPLLPPEFREIYDKYLKTERDKHNEIFKDRKLTCTKLIKDAMASALTVHYVSRINDYVSQDRSSAFSVQAQELSRQLRGIINNIKWASRKDHKKMVRLANKIKIVNILPTDVYRQLMNKNEFEKYNLLLCLSDKSTLESYLKVNTVNRARNAELGKGSNYTVFHKNYDVFDASIYFEYDSNEIVVPMVYLYYPAFDDLWPKYLSYGGLAVWVATELFKIVGYGNVLDPEIQPKGIQGDYWSNETISDYEFKRECALKDYNEFLKPFKIQIDDANCLENTLNIAAAVQAAYKAYKENTRMRFFVEPRIPYLKKYTVDQIFFIKYASSFCRFEGPGHNWYKKKTDGSKVSNNFTVNYSLRNFPLFLKAFKCDKKDKMYKEEPCDIWQGKTN